MSEIRQAGAAQGIVLVLIGCMPILGTLLVAPVLPSMVRHFEATPRVAYLVPFVQTAPAFVLAFAGPFAGDLAAKIGRTRLLIASMLLYVVAAPSPIILEGLHAIIASRLFVGLAEAGLMTASTMLIGDYYSGATRERYLSMQVLASSISAVIFITVGGVLGEGGWRIPFYAYLAPVVLIPLALWFLWEPEEQGLERGSVSGDTPFPWASLFRIIFVTFFAGMCMNLMSVELSFIVDSLGVTDPSIIGIVAAINSAGIVLGALLFASGRLPSKSPRVLSFAFALASLGYLLLFLAKGPILAATAGFVTGVASGIYLPWLLASANYLLGFEHRGRGVGIWMSSYFLAVVCGPVIATSIAVPAGGLQRAMIVFAMLLLLLSVFAPVIMRSAVAAMLRNPH